MRFNKVSNKKIIGAILFILFSLFFGKNNMNKNSLVIMTPTPIKTTLQNNLVVKVKRVIDGDTIEIEDGKIVRYIGIDTPELHHPTKKVQCFGKEAMEINKKLIEGKTVRLNKDVSETDRYGRLLRYVYLFDSTATIEGKFINKYLVREGYAHAATFPPDITHSKEFVEDEKYARENNKGLWDKCSY